MIPIHPAKKTPLRTLRILAWVLSAAAGIALVVFAMLSGNQKTARTEGVFAMYAQPRAVPDVRFTDGKGQAVTLQGFRGKLVLLNVWATWCPPCRMEMPALDRLQKQLGGPDFEVVALSIDQGQQSLYLIQEFYLQTGIQSLGVYMDTSGDASRDLGVSALPTTLLIDREGREIGRKIGPAEWDSAEIVAQIRDHLAPSASSPGQP